MGQGWWIIILSYMAFQATNVHLHRCLTHAIQYLYFTSWARAVTCAAGKTKIRHDSKLVIFKTNWPVALTKILSVCWPACPTKLSIYGSPLQWRPLCRNACYQPLVPIFSAASWTLDKAQHHTTISSCYQFTYTQTSSLLCLLHQETHN